MVICQIRMYNYRGEPIHDSVHFQYKKNAYKMLQDLWDEGMEVGVNFNYEYEDNKLKHFWYLDTRYHNARNACGEDYTHIKFDDYILLSDEFYE